MFSLKAIKKCPQVRKKKTRKQPKCLFIDDRIKRTWYIYVIECHSATRRSEMPLFTMTWMDLENIMLTKSDRKNQELYDFNCMWDIKLRTTNEQTDKETDKQKLIARQQSGGDHGGRGVGQR